MIYMGLDTSGRSASVAIMEDNTLLYECTLNTGLTHSETLLELVQQALTQCHLTPQQVDVWGVCSGPGSFTGLRIGIALVKGLSFGTNAVCAPVSTLEAQAFGLPAEGTVVSALDARRGQVYWAGFSAGAVPTRLTSDEASSLDCLDEFVENCKKPLFFVGDGAGLCYNRYDSIAGVRPCTPVQQCCPASGVCLAAKESYAKGLCVPPAQLMPNYLRLSQAERERKARLEGEPAT